MSASTVALVATVAASEHDHSGNDLQFYYGPHKDTHSIFARYSSSFTCHHTPPEAANEHWLHTDEMRCRVLPFCLAYWWPDHVACWFQSVVCDGRIDGTLYPKTPILLHFQSCRKNSGSLLLVWCSYYTTNMRMREIFKHLWLLKKLLTMELDLKCSSRAFFISELKNKVQHLNWVRKRNDHVGYNTFYTSN